MNNYVNCTVIILALAAFYFYYNSCSDSTKKSLKENFGMLNLTYRTEPVEYNTSDGKFFSTPGYEPTIAPRFSSTGYGAFINEKAPAMEHQAVPSDPLSFGDMVAEGYKHGDDQHASSKTVSAHEASDEQKKYDPTEYPDASSMLPVGDMTSADSQVQDAQTITYNHLMYANRRDRLMEHQCPIRGANLITPTVQESRVSVNRELMPTGALGVIAGYGNEHFQRTAEELAEISGGTKTIAGGSDLTQDLSTNLSANLSDVSVTAFQ